MAVARKKVDLNDTEWILMGKYILFNVNITAREKAISTGREPLFSTGRPTDTGCPILNETSFNTGQNARY